jgi:hypothetical protein
VRSFTRAECLAYVPHEWRGDHYDSGHLSPRRKLLNTNLWLPWAWRTPAFVTGHITILDRMIPERHLSFPMQPPLLLGYAERAVISSKSFAYQCRHRGSTKPPAKPPVLEKTLWGEAFKLVIPGSKWRFNGHGLHYTERFTLIMPPKRNGRRVRPSFKLKINRVRNLPSWAEQLIRVKVKDITYHFRSARFDWKPEQRKAKSVHWTRAPKIETADLRHFLRMPPYKCIY